MEIGEGLGVISTLFATWAALYISNQWRNQKGSEILAKKCENIIIEIDELYELIAKNSITYLECIVKKSDDKLFWIEREKIGCLYSSILKNLIIVSTYKKELLSVRLKVLTIYSRYDTLICSFGKLEGDKRSISSNDFQNNEINTLQLHYKMEVLFRLIEIEQHKINLKLTKFIFFQ